MTEKSKAESKSLVGLDQEGASLRSANQQQEPEPTRLEIWVDDCKPAPNGCAVARTYDDALRMLRSFEYSKLYLDHDLGDSIYDKTGYDLLMVLIAEGRVPPVVECISWNPAGRKRIADALKGLEKST